MRKVEVTEEAAFFFLFLSFVVNTVLEYMKMEFLNFFHDYQDSPKSYFEPKREPSARTGAIQLLAR